ncbi:FUSC family protein [Rhodococcus sp. IEGM 1408]|uniref:FUSC family protein n=1 Tax=Rhodococcus sp. IEGM 1408 TaxID=3082220 RepID=UPI0029537AAF|nr:FUSC family protein [Rhodococcus sp. IEGM 1408]MDV8000183.1 FUSC family protein [Rhodococcus sp. IEGM 1408]
MTRTPLGQLLRPLVTLAPSPPRLPNAIKAGLTVLLCLAIPTLLGRLDLGLLTVTGTFAVLYAPAAPIRRRAATVAGIGLGLITATALGAFTAGSYLAFAVTAILLAMVTAGLCLALRVGPPGSYFLVLCAGIAYLVVGEHGVQPALVPAMTAVGAAVAWLVTMAELLPDPRKPERLAVHDAQRAVAAYADASPGPDSRPRHRAAALALAAAEEAVVEGMWTPSESITADLAAARREYNDRAARATLHIVPGEDPAWDPRNPDAGRWLAGSPESSDVDLPSAAAAERAEHAITDDERRHIGSLRWRLSNGLRWPGEPWSVAASVGVATAVSIVLLTVLAGSDQPHLYWVIAFSALVLHQGGPRAARTYRALHRLTGTVVGLGLFLIVATMQPSGWWLIGVIVALQFAIELLVTRNYGLAVALITPLALLIASGGNVPEQPLPLVGERLVDTVIGVVVALAVLWGLGRRAHHRAVRGDTRRALRELAEFARGHTQRALEPTLASTLRDLNTSNSLLIADGYGHSPESRTAEAVTYAGYLMLGTHDRRFVSSSASRWAELADAALPSGWRPVEADHPADARIRHQCERMGAMLD